MAIESRGYPRMTVTPKAERSIRNGHPWVYGGEVVQIDGEPQDGGLADVLSPKGSYLGTGLVNRHSKILVRLLSRNANDRFDEAFFRRRIAYALDYRQAVMETDFACCRLIFGEADQLPGLTVDRFSDILVTQILSLGMEQRKPLLFRLLVEELEKRGARPRAIYERNDVAIRELEGMEQGKGFVEMDGLETGLSGHVEICENGVYYDVDYMEGQKTGFFLDQKYNRQAVARLAKGRRVLDCFTHTGRLCPQRGQGRRRPGDGGGHFPIGYRPLQGQRRPQRHRGDGVPGGGCVRPFGGAGRSRKKVPMILSSWTRPPLPNPPLQPAAPSVAIRRSTAGPWAYCPGAGIWPPAPAPTLCGTRCSGRCSTKHPLTRAAPCGRSKPGSRPRIIPSCRMCRKRTI